MWLISLLLLYNSILLCNAEACANYGGTTCTLGDWVCGMTGGPDVCPLLCGVCTTPAPTTTTTLPYSAPKFTNVTMIKTSCPKSKSGVVACWEVDWANDHGKDIIYFRVHPDISALYVGELEVEQSATILGIGDILHGINEATFHILSGFTDGKRVEVNVDSTTIPVYPKYFKSLSADEVSTRTLSEMARHLPDSDIEVLLDLQSDEPRIQHAISNNNLIDRAALPACGYKLIIQPVYDQKLEAGLGASVVSAQVEAMMVFVKAAFKDATLTTAKFDITVNTPVKINANLKADANSYVSIISTSGFSFTSLSPTPNVVLFITQTPPDQVTADFKLEFSIAESVCKGSLATQVAIIEYFGTNLIASEAAIRGVGSVLGFKNDYLGTGVVRQERTLNGKSCTGIGGFMDTPPGSKLWTDCSNEDLKTAITNDKLTCLTEADCGTDCNPCCPVFVQNIANACDTAWIKAACSKSCNPLSSGTGAAIPTAACFACDGSTTAAGGGTIVPGGGTTAPGGGTAAPGGDTTAAGGGTTGAGGDTTPAGEGSTGAGGDTTPAGGGSTGDGGDTTAAGGGTGGDTTAAGGDGSATCAPCPTDGGGGGGSGGMTTTVPATDPKADCLEACPEMKRVIKCSFSDVAQCCRYSCNDRTSDGPGGADTTAAGGGGGGADTTAAGGGGGGADTTAAGGGGGGGGADTTAAGGGGGGTDTTAAGGGGGGADTTAAGGGGGGADTTAAGGGGGSGGGGGAVPGPCDALTDTDSNCGLVDPRNHCTDPHYIVVCKKTCCGVGIV